MKYLARFIMWLAGWKYKGELPTDKKAVIISVPHTSNWDFIWGELAFLSQGIPAFILMKKEFFFFPLGKKLRSFIFQPFFLHSLAESGQVSDWHGRRALRQKFCVHLHLLSVPPCMNQKYIWKARSFLHGRSP